MIFLWLEGIQLTFCKCIQYAMDIIIPNLKLCTLSNLQKFVKIQIMFLHFLDFRSIPYILVITPGSLLLTFYKIGVPNKFSKFTWRHICRSLFFIKLQTSSLHLYLKRDYGIGVSLWIFGSFWGWLF